jgi:hypothetical protein
MMNAQIRKLAEQAGMEDYPIQGVNSLHGEQCVEKFAELLIRECAHVGFQAAYPDKGVDAMVAIKEHFGL